MEPLIPQPVSKGPCHVRGATQLSAGDHDFVTDIVVHPDASLEIAAGAHVHFAPGVGLAVMGSLKIMGSETDPVTLGGKNWRGLAILGPQIKGVVLEHLQISGGVGHTWSGEFDEDGVPVFASENGDHAISGGGGFIAATGPEPILMTDVEFTDNAAAHRGGALAALQATLQLTRCTFTDNQARDGGALYLQGAGVEFDTCTFSNNGAELNKGTGGAIVAIETNGRLVTCTFTKNHNGAGGALSCTDSSLTLQECRFEENLALQQGGALQVTGQFLPQLIKGTFAKNQATGAGGAAFVQSQGNRSLTIQECLFEGNLAGEYGGALASGPATRLEITQCTFVGNQGDENSTELAGGALHCGAGSRIGVLGSRFQGNSAHEGGAIACDSRANPDGESVIHVALKETTFDENRAVQSGGAIAVSSHGTLDVGERCKFSTNEAGSGGGAIYIAIGGKILMGATGFTSNRASHGGALAWHGARGRLDGCIFGKNEAREFGGAIAAYAAIYLHSCKFIQNIAQTIGGALWCADADSIIGACTFTANTAGATGGGAIRCEADDGPYQGQNEFSKNLPNDVSYLEKAFPAPSQKNSKHGGSCWIVTAYYGDPYDPHVCAIRAMRDAWLADPRLHAATALLNALYVRGGEGALGRWWRGHLVTEGWVRHFTRLLCRALYTLARR